MTRTDAAFRRAVRAPGAAEPAFESIVTGPGESFVWRLDDYPTELGQWNYHPEFEIHLIRKSSGVAYVGDHVERFEPGHLAVIGSHLPHHWITDIAPGDRIEGRDVVLQFDPNTVRSAASMLPELGGVEDVLDRAMRGLLFFGGTASRGAALLEQIGLRRGLDRLAGFLALLALLASSDECRCLSSHPFVPRNAVSNEKLKVVLNYIHSAAVDQVTMADAARMVSMTDTSFSRYFRRAMGRTFTSYVRAVRIGASCRLLGETDLSVTDVCFEVGFRNISNFNRQFVADTGLTPREYRRRLRDPLCNRGSLAGSGKSSTGIAQEPS